MKKLKCKKPSFFYQALIYIFYVDTMPVQGYWSFEWPNSNFYQNTDLPFLDLPRGLEMFISLVGLINAQVFQEFGIYAIN